MRQNASSRGILMQPEVSQQFSQKRDIESYVEPDKYRISSHNIPLSSIFMLYSYLGCGAWGNVVGWGTMLQAGRSRVRVPMRSLDFFDLPNPSNRIMALGSTQPLTQMSTRNISGW
jgi:hypothetical protein